MTTQAKWFEGFSAFVEEWTRKREAGRDFGDEYIGDNPFPHFALASEARSWEDFLRWVAELEGRWYFRGQREAMWDLHTSLDRAVERITKTPHSFSLMHLDRQAEMRPLLARFQQDAHNFLPHIPALDDLGSWYALMQHYCAPTPLLDWTESPYVGAYFAVEQKASEGKKEEEPHSALWAVDADWLEEKKRELFKEKIFEVSDSNKLFEHSGPLVVRINPSMSNPRLFAQQGVFLSKLIDGATFAQLLMTMMMHEGLTDKPVIRKLEIGSSLRIKFIKNLRAMNIHRASLFPGLDGLGTLLKLDLELKDRN